MYNLYRGPEYYETIERHRKYKALTESVRRIERKRTARKMISLLVIGAILTSIIYFLKDDVNDVIKVGSEVAHKYHSRDH